MKNVIAALFFSLSVSLFGQDFQAQYEELFITKNREAIPALLHKWEETKPQNPEVLIAWFNYYFWESRSEVLQLSTEANEGENLTLYKDNPENPAGYMNSVIVYDDSLFNLSQSYIQKAIDLAPRRLDIHFGRIFSLQTKEDYKEEVKMIMELLKLHQENQTDWYWSEDEKMTQANEEIKNSIQEYIFTLFNAENAYLAGIEEISLKMVEIYGDHVESYSNLGVCSLFKGNLEMALGYFLKANQIEPNDVIVISNIAHTYFELGNKEKSIEFYHKLIEKGSEEDAKFASTRINQLEAEVDLK